MHSDDQFFRKSHHYKNKFQKLNLNDFFIEQFNLFLI